MHPPSASRDPWDVLLEARRRDVVRVGLALPLSGPLALTAPSALDLAGLAADEADAAGRVGRPVELVPLDAGRPPAVVTREAAALQAAGAVDVLVRFCTTRAEGLALRELPLHRD